MCSGFHMRYGKAGRGAEAVVGLNCSSIRIKRHSFTRPTRLLIRRTMYLPRIHQQLLQYAIYTLESNYPLENWTRNADLVFSQVLGDFNRNLLNS